ncbi:MAG: invasin domain 3-containing protein, partial [Balneolaceae bacterium]
MRIDRFSKILVLFWLCSLLGGSFFTAMAQDVIGASGGTEISIDNVAAGTYSSLSGPSIRETAAGQLTNNGTIILTSPAGFEWNTGSTVTLNVIPRGAQNTSLNAEFTSINATETVITITSESKAGGAGQGPGRIDVSGLEVRPTNTSVPNSGTITNTGTTGPTSLSYGSLSTSVGAVSQVLVESEANGSGQVVQSQNLRVGDDLTVYAIARDVGNNFIENIALDDPSDWSLINITGGVSQSALTVASNRQQAIFSSQQTGSANIRAFYDGVTLTPSETITLTPRTASMMEIETQPSSSATAGEEFGSQPVIHLLDQFGNLVSMNNDKEISVEIETGDGDLFGIKNITATNGTVNFTDLSIQKSGTYTLRFSADGLDDIISNEITVTAASPTDLTFVQQPSTVSQNSTIDPPVELQLLDEFANEVNTNGIEVSISEEPYFANNATLIGNSNENGIAIFDELRIRQNSTSDTYTFDAFFDDLDDSQVTYTKTSNSFDIISSDGLSGFSIKTTGNNDIGEQEAGVDFDIQLSALDGDDAVITDFSTQYTGTIELSADASIDNSSTISFSEQDFTDGVLTTTIALNSSGDTQIYADFDGTNELNETISRSGRSESFSVNPSNVDFTNTLFSASPEQLIADGQTTSEITVQLRDEFENPLISGGENVTISTTSGELSGDGETGTTVQAIDNSDGTYTATLTSSTNIETATLEAFEDGNSISTLDVEFIAGSVEELLIFIPESGGEPENQSAGNPFNITVEAIDQNGNRVQSYSGDLEFSSTSDISSGETATISNGILTDHSITLTRSGTARTISAEDIEQFGIDGVSDEFTVIPGAPSLQSSSVLASPAVIQNDGSSTSTITIILRDEFDNRLTQDLVEDLSLEIEQLELNGDPSSGNPDANISSLTYSSSSNSYNAALTASTTSEQVEVTGLFTGGEIVQKAIVDIVVPNTWQPGGGPESQQTDWTRGENWSLGAQPTSNDFVVIPGDANPFPDLDLNVSVGSLEIQNGAELILFGGNSITVSGGLLTDGTLDIEDNTSLIVGGGVSGSGTFTSGDNTDIKVGGNVSIESLLARTQGTVLEFNGSSQQEVSTPNLLIQSMRVLNDVLVTSGNLIDTAEIEVTENNTFELAVDAGITLDNLENIFGDGSLLLNNNTLVVRGDLSLLNIDTSDGTVIFGVRLDEDPTQFSLQQQQIANLTQMRNAIINNNQGVRTFDDIIINDEGSLLIENGELIISSGKNFIASNIQYGTNGSLTFRRTMSQSGWRLLSSPITTTFADWFNGLTLQGMAGASFTDRQPNLLFYDETFPGTDNQRWRTPGDASDNLTAGRGYFFYVFGEVSDDTDYNDPLPETLTVSGEEHVTADNSPFDLNVTYTAEADTGFNLIGNPFGATINWDDDSWVKENMDNVIYIWDEASNQYKTWNGVSGSHNSGNIAPFQGFWVKANNDDTEITPSLQVSPDAKTTGGVFRKSRNATVDHEWPIIEMQVEGADMQHSTHFTFTESGRNNIDNMDAYRLLPFDTNTYLEIFALMDDGTELAITNLPRNFGKKIELPLHVSGVNNGAFIDNTISLSWPQLVNIPEGWTITLID